MGGGTRERERRWGRGRGEGFEWRVWRLWCSSWRVWSEVLIRAKPMMRGDAVELG